MSDHHHDHGWHDDHGSHGITPPPDDEQLRQWAEQGARGNVRAVEPVPLHFFFGPERSKVRPLSRTRRIRLRSGAYRTVMREFVWFLERVEGTTRTKALDRMYDVLLADRGWTRAGVHWKRTTDRSKTDIIIRVLPQDKTVCGARAAGCYSWGYEPDGKPVAEMGVEYIDREGPWAALVNMEVLGHGTFYADDQYFAVHQPYPYGVMGDWQAMAQAGYMPTDQEVADTVAWMNGQIPRDRIHFH